ncbi:MAG: hypothetical protein HDR11_10225 [Lachnospiraceae bacterium]|nr:hypothetical protein [Lachnospiraceae bacterium]
MEKNLADEIVKEAKDIPTECQEKILDIVKAMAFTRKVIMKEENNSAKK